MSSLAKIFLGQGAVVFGSDAEEEFFTDEILKKLGVKVRKFNAKNIAKNLDFSKSKMSKLVRKLEEKNLVERKPYFKTNIIKLSRKIK